MRSHLKQLNNMNPLTMMQQAFEQAQNDMSQPFGFEPRRRRNRKADSGSEAET